MKKLIISIATILAGLAMFASFVHANTTGGINLTQGGTGWTSSTPGDLLIGTSSPIRYSILPIGSNGSCLEVATGSVVWVACPTGNPGTVTSITAGTGLSGGTITNSGTVSLNLANNNVWSGGQIFTNASTTNFSITGISGSTQCLQVNSAGVISGAGSSCSSSSGYLLYNPTTNVYYVATTTSPLVLGEQATSTNIGAILEANGTIAAKAFAGYGGAGLITLSNSASETATTTITSTTTSSFPFGIQSPCFESTNTGPCITSTSTVLTPTTNLWVDGNRQDSYTANGSIQFPFKTVSSANSFVTASSGITNVTVNLTPPTGGGVYFESSMAWNIPITFNMNGASIALISTSTGAVGAGAMTFSSNAYVGCNGGAFFGTVIESDAALSDPHSFDHCLISGVFHLYGNGLFSHGAIVDQNKNIFPFLSQTASGSIVVEPSALTNFDGNNLQVVIDNFGDTNFDDNNLQVATNTVYAITSTSTNSYVHIVGMSLENYGNGGGINTTNITKSTPPDFITSIGFTGGVGSNPFVITGTSSAYINNYQAFDVAGNVLSASSSAYLAARYLGIEVDGNGMYGANTGSGVGLSTFAGPISASSTVTIIGTSTLATTTITSLSVTSGATSTFTGGIQAPCFATSTGQPCIVPGSSLGGSSQWTTSGQNIYYNAGFVGIGSTTPSSPLSIASSTTASTTQLFTIGSSTTNIFDVSGNNGVAIGTSSLSSNCLLIALCIQTTPNQTNGWDVYNSANTFEGGMTSAGGITILGGYTSDAGTFLASFNGVANYGNTFGSSASTNYKGGSGATSAMNILSTTGAGNGDTINFATNNFNQQPMHIYGDTGNGYVGIGTSTNKLATLFVQGTSSNPTIDIFDVASSSGSTTESINAAQHIVYGGPTPTVSGGTSAIVVPSNDNSGQIAVAGTALTSVTLTFATPWKTAPNCTEGDNQLVVSADITSISTTSVVFGFGTGGVTTATIWYNCSGSQ